MYGYKLYNTSVGVGFLQTGGDTVTVLSLRAAWPRCMSCDSTHCLHMQEMWTQAGLRMPDECVEERPPSRLQQG